MSRDLNTANDSFEDGTQREVEKDSQVVEMKRYLDNNPELVTAMFRVYANLMDEPR